MSRYKIVIANAALAQRQEIDRNVKARVARDVAARQGKGGPGRKLPDSEIAHLTRAHRRDCEQKFKLRAAGTVHDVADTDCPNGICLACGFILHDFTEGDACDQCGSANTERRPNCRNCGDPQHEARCRAQGHCPDCGTKHGVAPDRILSENGYALVEVTAEDETAESVNHA